MEIRKYIEENEQRFIDELFSLIRIPSISALPQHKEDMLACAERWRQLLIEAGADMDAISAGMAKDIASFQTSVEGSIDTSGIDDLEADLNMGTSWAMPDNIIDFPTYGTDDTTWTQPAGWDQMVVDDGSAMQFQAPVVITSEESGSVLSAIRDIVDDIRTSVQNRKEGSTITLDRLVPSIIEHR